MDTSVALHIAHKIVASSGKSPSRLAAENILDYIDLTVQIVKDWPATRRKKATKLNEFLVSLKMLEDDAADIISKDPAMLYRPAHSVSEAVHQSQAFIRNLHSGNRCSKTTVANIENFWHVTDQHPYRDLPPGPLATFMIGPNFSKYAPNVFEKKFITGEPGNPISPLFPEGGKWLYKYDERKHIIYICCKDCATAGQAKSCPHPKGTLTLFSDVEGPLVLAGGQYVFGHLDEQIKKALFTEALQRLKTVRNSNLMVTETPLGGEAFWTYKDLYLKSLEGAPLNWNTERGAPIVESFTIDQYAAGLISPEEIEASKQTMSEAEIQVRIYGRYVSALEDAVFNQSILHRMTKELQEPLITGYLAFGSLIEDEGKPVPPDQELLESGDYYGRELKPVTDFQGSLQIFEQPQPAEQYIIGADVAFGMTKRDFSAAVVFKLVPRGLDVTFEQVALLRGWVGTLDYAIALYKLGLYYHRAMLIPENNGPGLAVIQFLNERFKCDFLFKDTSNRAEELLQQGTNIGINTNLQSKGMMISILQSVISPTRRGLIIRSDIVLRELKGYVQETLPGGTARFTGAGDLHDDTVIACALPIYAAKTFPLYDVERAREEKAALNRTTTASELSDHEQHVWETVHTNLNKSTRENN